LFFKKVCQFLLSDPVDVRAFKIIRLFFFACILILFSWLVYFSLLTITIPYQIEYREGAAQVMTRMLLQGDNPFLLENQPLGMNNYGIGYNLVVLPFARLFGNTLMVHRSISFTFLIASLLLIVITLWTIKQDALSAVTGGIFTIVLLAGFGGVGAFPATMGEFLFLATILIPFLYSFSNSSLIVSALLSIAAFYTKPYFVFGFGIVVIYTSVFISKQKGILYTLFFLSVFALSFLGVRYLFKLYFIDTLVGNFFNASRSPAHLRMQLMEMGVEFYPSILLGVLLLFFSLPNFSFQNLIQLKFPSRTDLLRLDIPLLHAPINYFAFTFVSGFLGFILILGLHKGSYMNYAYQIVLPPFILWSLQILKSRSRFSTIAFGLLIGNILLLEGTLLNPAFLRQGNSVAWRQLYDDVLNSQRVLNSPVIVSVLLDANRIPIDSGQSEYYYNIGNYPNHILIGPSYEEFRNQGVMYRQSIQNAIKGRTFDKIFTTENYGNLIDLDLISRFYVQIDSITIEMPQTHQTWTIGVWAPQGK